ncbi:MAG: ABC transporter permease [Vicinamibacterales bacterium]
MTGLLSDVRLAFRQLRTQPLFAAAAILSLGLGIGLNVAVFSVIDGVLLRPSPIADPDRVVMVWETDRGSGTTREPASLPDALDFQARTRTLGELAVILAGERNLVPPAGDPVRLASLQVSPTFLPLLGLAPLTGRGFTEADADAGTAAIISESLWTRMFDRRPDIVGRTIRLDDRPFEIVGVLGTGADFGILQVLGSAAYARSFADRGVRQHVDVWTPLGRDTDAFPRATHPFFVLDGWRPA